MKPKIIVISETKNTRQIAIQKTIPGQTNCKGLPYTTSKTKHQVKVNGQWRSAK